MKFSFAFLLLTVPFFPLADSRSFVAYRSHGLQQGLISPKLDPGSDRVFFGEDYPDNLQPKGQLKSTFKHPYPAVQDTDHFDKDYVKDENSDDGEWQAQMDYDLLRTKVTEDRDDVAKAKVVQEERKKTLDKARAEEAAATKKADEASKRAEQARKAAEKAQEEAAAAKEATDKAAEHQIAEEQRKAAEPAETQTRDDSKPKEDAAEPESASKEKSAKDNSDKIAEAVAKVKKETSDLDKCQQELADARARLKELMAQEEELSRKRQEQRELAKAEKDAQMAAYAREEAIAAAALAKLEREVAKLRYQEHLRKDALLKGEAAHEVADRQYAQGTTDIQKLESDLKTAETRLRRFRQSEDAGGGVSNRATPAGRTQMFGARSSALHGGVSAAVTALLVVAFM
mmetsp:Transcript_132257/g.257713  ORF Transcript_132257/g.257713 Transcript_132257/m.257713 type:complete len:401 (+) Transcript_132257:43-1245(+)